MAGSEHFLELDIEVGLDDFESGVVEAAKLGKEGSSSGFIAVRSGGVGEGHELGAFNDGSDGFIGGFFGELDCFEPVLCAGLVSPFGGVFSCGSCFSGVG